MKLSDRLYTILKWLVCIVIPAFTTAYVGLSAEPPDEGDEESDG